MREIKLTLVLALGLLTARPAAAREPAAETPTGAGALELGLGVLLSGTAVGLVAFGAVQLVRAREHLELCRRSVDVIDESGGSRGGIDPCVFDPPALGFASAGLSWGFAVPLAVGAGLLFARGHRLRLDAWGHDRGAIRARAWVGRSGGGAGFDLRF